MFDILFKLASMPKPERDATLEKYIKKATEKDIILISIYFLSFNRKLKDTSHENINDFNLFLFYYARDGLKKASQFLSRDEIKSLNSLNSNKIPNDILLSNIETLYSLEDIKSLSRNKYLTPEFFLFSNSEKSMLSWRLDSKIKTIAPTEWKHKKPVIGKQTFLFATEENSMVLPASLGRYLLDPTNNIIPLKICTLSVNNGQIKRGKSKHIFSVFGYRVAYTPYLTEVVNAEDWTYNNDWEITGVNFKFNGEIHTHFFKKGSPVPKSLDKVSIEIEHNDSKKIISTSLF